MNIKMAINSQLSIIESKKQTEQMSRTGIDHRYRGHLEGWVGTAKGDKGGKLANYIRLTVIA